jgi:hypothetical protein
MLLTHQVASGKRIGGTAGQRGSKRTAAVFSKAAVRESNQRMRSPPKEVWESRKKRERSPSRGREEGMAAVDMPLKRMMKQAMKKREKARARQQRYLKKLRATSGSMGILELGSVKEPQRRDYARRLQAFYDFVALHDLPLQTEKELDEALCDFADHLYLNGEGNDAGQKLKAAIEFVRPEAMRKGELHLPRFKRSLKGWRKLAPSQTRLPMIEFVKSSISAIMLHTGHRMMALFNELTFSTYARPGEMMKIQAVDVVERNRQFHHHVVVVAPFEREESSKSGIYDEVLILDDSRMMGLGDIVVAESKKALKERGDEAKMWSFSAAQYLKVWRACVQVLQVEAVAESPYQNRHGGASRDHLLKLRSVAEIQRRGRWAADASARVYDKPGRLQQIINKFSSKLEPLGEETRKNFTSYFYGKSIRLPREIQKRVMENFKGCPS